MKIDKKLGVQEVIKEKLNHYLTLNKYNTILREIDLQNSRRGQGAQNNVELSESTRAIYDSLGFTGYRPIYDEIYARREYLRGNYLNSADYYVRAAQLSHTIEEQDKKEHGGCVNRVMVLYENAARSYELAAHAISEELKGKPELAMALYLQSARCYLEASNRAYKTFEDSKDAYDRTEDIGLSRLFYAKAERRLRKAQSIREGLEIDSTKTERNLETDLRFAKVDLFPELKRLPRTSPERETSKPQA